jgi:hypothetical protein
MNSLFVDAVTKAKSQVTGFIPADRAVAVSTLSIGRKSGTISTNKGAL